MRVLICGSVQFDDFELLKTKCDALIPTGGKIEIVSGGAAGADALAERYARMRRFGLRVFKAKWGLYGKAAGPIRNRAMVDYVVEDGEGMVIAFWNGFSRGTKNTIDIAERLGVKVELILF